MMPVITPGAGVLPSTTGHSLKLFDQPTGLPFGSMLAPTSDASQACTKPVEQRLYTFDELGMFGLRATADLNAQDGIEDAARNGGLVPPLSDNPAGRNAENILSEMRPATQSAWDIDAGHTAWSAAAHGAQSGTPAAKSTVGLLKGSAAPLCETADSIPQERGAAPARPSARQVSQTPSPVGLLISGADNALQILARSATAEDKLRLRKLMQEAAGEFGMDISDITINGEAITQVVPSSIGGPNGGRRR